MLDDDIAQVRASGLFDVNWYLERYPDVRQAGLDPIEHYLRYGVTLRRNPGPGFDTAHYLRANPDIVEAGVNPLVHYVRYGRGEGRSPKLRPIEKTAPPTQIDVVVPVHNTLPDVKKCLEAVRRNTDGFDVQLIVVDDGSDAETAGWLQAFEGRDRRTKLLVNETNIGYTSSVNRGLRASRAPYVVLLNSDTIVTPNWLRAILACFGSAPQIGIVGPLSNAATWQSVPELCAGNDFAINPLPPDASPDDLAKLVSGVAERAYPRVPFVNGFCFVIRRPVIDKIGYMDEEAFPIGYGEENDYCIRAAKAGFELAIADDAYVFHAKSKSFGSALRGRLSVQGAEALQVKHGAHEVAALVNQIKANKALHGARDRMREALLGWDRTRLELDVLSQKLLYLLPVKGGSGGAHSVVQEANEMRRFGMEAKVGVHARDLNDYAASYEPEIPAAHDLFCSIDVPDLDLANAFDIVVATIFSSVRRLAALTDLQPRMLPCYYVQDYEPMFFEPQTDNWVEARRSYAAIPRVTLFAKTDWIRRRVMAEHGIAVHKVAPGLDHSVYYPGARTDRSTINLTAMIRPQTPHRGAARTMRVLSRLATSLGKQVSIDLFGCDDGSTLFRDLPRDFPFKSHGALSRTGVASVLRASDLFIDLSDYQAFGRTALEAMACGCAAVVPREGGADEYAVNGVNTIVVDTSNEDEAVNQICAIVRSPLHLRRMQRAALETAARYSVRIAAISELNLFARELALHRAALHARRSLPPPDKPCGRFAFATGTPQQQ